MLMNNRYICSILLLVFLLAGCDNTAGTDDADRIPVELYVSPLKVSESGTRAGAMNGWYNTEVYMSYGESVAPGGSYAGFSRTLRGLVADSKTNFQPMLFYPAGGQNIFLRGFHPRDGVTGLGSNGQITDNKIHYTLSGQEDIMVSNVVVGSMNNTLLDQGAALDYEHLLTQISFSVRVSGAVGNFPYELKLKAIRVVNVHNEAILDLNPALNYSDSGILTFTGDPEHSLTAFENAAGIIISQYHWLGPVGLAMFEPGVPFEVEAEFINGTKVRINSVLRNSDGVNLAAGNTERSKTYAVELFFKYQSGIPKVTANWTTVGIGSDTGWW